MGRNIQEILSVCAWPYREEEDKGMEGVGKGSIGSRVLDDSTANTEEGCRAEEGNVLEGKGELLQEGLALHQVVWLIGEVDLRIDLAQHQQGAEDGCVEERSPAHPEVEEHQQLEGSLRLELTLGQDVGDSLHLWGVDEDGQSFGDNHQAANQVSWVFEEKGALRKGVDHPRGQRDAPAKVPDHDPVASS